MAQTWRTGVTTHWTFSIWFDGTYVHYAYGPYSSQYIYYRRGTPGSDGNISWSATEQTINIGASMEASEPTICVDSGGYATIGFTNNSNYPAVVRNANTDGTWSTASGYPLALSTATAANTYKVSMCLINGVAYAAYVNDYGALYGKLHSSGSTWGSEETIYSTHGADYGHAISLGEAADHTLYCAFGNWTPYDVLIAKRNYDTGVWSIDATIETGGDYNTCIPRIAVLPNGDLYVFVQNYPNTDSINLKKRLSGTWDSSWTDLTSETGVQNMGKHTATNEVTNGKLGYFFAAGTTPYTLYFIGYDFVKSTTKTSDARIKKAGNQITKNSDARVIHTYNEWNPTSGNLASTNANWTHGHAPTTGEEVRFVGSLSTANCTWDITTAVGDVTVDANYTGTITQSSTNASFASWTHNNGTYTQGSKTITIVGNLTVNGGTWQGSGSSVYWCNLGGNLSFTAGTMTNYYTDINFTGSGKTINHYNSGWVWGNIKIASGASVTYQDTGAGTNMVTEYLTVESTGVLTISSGKTFNQRLYLGTTTDYVNNGQINGSGTLAFILGNNDRQHIFGVVNCPVTMSLFNGATTNRTVTLTTNTSLGSTFSISSADPTELMILDLSGYTLTTTGTTIGTRGKIAGWRLTKTSDARINPAVTQRSVTKNSNARVKKAGIQVTKNSDARVKKLGTQTTKNSDARIKKTGIQTTKASDARVKKTSIQTTKNSDARIKKAGNSTTKTSDALIILNAQLKARYDMETLVETTKLKDLSGFANHGTPAGGVTIGGVAGKNANATSFDATDDNISLGSGASITSMTNLSIAVWVYITAYPSALYPIIGAENSKYQLAITSEGKVEAKLLLSGVPYTKTFGATNAVGLNSWQHIVFTFNGTSWDVYINTIKQTTQTQSGTLDTTASTIYLGRGLG